MNKGSMKVSVKVLWVDKHHLCKNYPDTSLSQILRVFFFMVIKYFSLEYLNACKIHDTTRKQLPLRLIPLCFLCFKKLKLEVENQCAE